MLRVKAVPGARRDEIVGLLGDRIKVRVAAPPEDGKANAAILKFIAQIAGVRASEITIISGQTSSTKLLEIEGIDADSMNRAILMSNEESHAT